MNRLILWCMLYLMFQYSSARADSGNLGRSPEGAEFFVSTTPIGDLCEYFLSAPSSSVMVRVPDDLDVLDRELTGRLAAEAAQAIFERCWDAALKKYEGYYNPERLRQTEMGTVLVEFYSNHHADGRDAAVEMNATRNLDGMKWTPFFGPDLASVKVESAG